MFRSARLKLTLFYLIILVVFSVSTTAAVRVLAEREYDRSNSAQRIEVRRLVIGPKFGYTTNPYDAFSDVQQDEADAWRQRLNYDLALINVFALIVGGALSYWFAGRTLDPIERAHEAQKRFAADASHELRTPLANMRVENEVFLRQKKFSEPEARTQLESNLEEVQRLENLSGNLLALTQYEQAALDLTPISVETFVAAAIEHAHKPAEARGVTFERHLAKARVLGHEESLVHLLGIILDNALKYGPEKSAVYLAGEILPSGEYRLRIRDQGPGVTPADLPFIFDRLYRGDKARSSKVGGYGLGLSLARQIARANHASISVSNHPQGGAVFDLLFALVK